MRQIGFKNFRKFEKFPAMDFSPITIFVGENNAGKSTVVKAILSVLEYIDSHYFQMEETEKDKSVLNHYFYFNKNYFAHIGTFARALYNRSKNSIISFTTIVSNVQCEIEIEGDRSDEEVTSGRINKITINLLRWNIEIEFDFLKDDIHAVFHKSPSPLYDPNVKEDSFVRYNSRNLDDSTYFQSVPDNAELHAPITGRTGMIGGSILSWLLYRFSSRTDKYIHNDRKGAKDKALFNLDPISDEMKTFLEKNKSMFSQYGSISMFGFTNQNDIEYIYAHSVSQTVTYSAKDSNDYLVKTIHEFANHKITKGGKIHKFIIKWMKAFNVGIDYDIKSVGGEAHIVKVKDKDGSFVNLADKGMGSIQLMILLFRLATKMADRQRPIAGKVAKTIIIEEPEQNIHPMLQSKLADLFYELNIKYGFKFIIETHSEYLIRKTQVIVKKIYEEKKKSVPSNPFKVYYFKSSGKGKPYYEMKYQKDGNFSNDFGKGFFDEASNLAFEIL